MTKKIYFVGSGNYDDGCFPGNIFMWLIDADMWLRAKWLLGGGYQSSEETPISRLINTLRDTGEDDEKALIDLEANHRFIKKNIAPYIEAMIVKFMESLGGIADTIEPNSEDGTYVLNEFNF